MLEGKAKSWIVNALLVLGTVVVFSLLVIYGNNNLIGGIDIAITTVVGLGAWAVSKEAKKTSEIDNKLADQRSDLELKVSSESSDPKAAWDLARVTLEQYFYRNLSQVTQIFYVAVAVMLVGFGLVIYGAYLALHQDLGGSLPSELSVISGIVTEFISVTVMVIYRSTLRQANSYMAILEKINAVGMAVQIVETIPKEDPLYMPTRSAMAKMLLEQFKQSASNNTKSASRKRKIQTVPDGNA